MKFLCLDCDEPMKLHSTAGPDEGSLTVTFRCPQCGVRVAMLTNPFETQMVRSLGVKVGGRTVPAAAAPTSADAVPWDTAAERRLANIPSFIRPMAKRSIERFAETKGYTTIT